MEKQKQHQTFFGRFFISGFKRSQHYISTVEPRYNEDLGTMKITL